MNLLLALALEPVTTDYTVRAVIVLLVIAGFVLFALVDEHRNRHDDDVERLLDERRDRERIRTRDA